MAEEKDKKKPESKDAKDAKDTKKKSDVAESDADENKEDQPAEPERKRMAGRTLVLFIVLPLVVVLAAGGGATWYFRTALFGHAEAPKPTGSMVTLFYDLPEMLVNLNTKGKQAAYLKLKIALELDDPTTVPKLERLMPRIVDNFQVYLRELRSEDLTGSAGLYRLREELLLRVNTAVAPARISDVLFKEMLVQ
jgi:flagellar FliL protein